MDGSHSPTISSRPHQDIYLPLTTNHVVYVFFFIFIHGIVTDHINNHRLKFLNALYLHCKHNIQLVLSPCVVHLSRLGAVQCTFSLIS